jgi:hypothetical protein
MSDLGHSIPVMRWSEFASMCPELAGIGQRRLEQRHLCLIGTLRLDGWPRITPVEPYLAGGGPMIGMIAGSRKAADLLRDPRLVIHSTVTRWEADEGDVKLYGTAKPVTGPCHRATLYQAMTQAHGWPEPPSDDPAYHVFCVEIKAPAMSASTGHPGRPGPGTRNAGCASRPTKTPPKHHPAHGRSRSPTGVNRGPAESCRLPRARAVQTLTAPGTL